MDDVELLIQQFETLRGGDQTDSKLDILLDLGSLRDQRITALLLAVVSDPAESLAVRLDVLNRLRRIALSRIEQASAVAAILAVLTTPGDARLRLQAATVLGVLAASPGAVQALAQVVLSRAEPFDLRYAALVSIERTGPSATTVDVLRSLRSDDVLGPAALSLLDAWHISSHAKENLLAMTSNPMPPPTQLEEQLDHEQVERANALGRPPVVFVHGLWLLPSSWSRWATLFEEAGYAALTPGWPDDPETVEQAAAHPEVFANKTVGQVADHLAEVIGRLDRKPAIIGHSFGGLLAQVLAGRGLSVATVAIDPAPFRGVLPLPISALRSALPVLNNPANRHRAVPLTYEQFRFSFANAVDEAQARRLFETYPVPASGAPIFQAATANLNPWTEASVRTRADNRGPLLLLSGEYDHTVPWAIVNASYKLQKRNTAVTEIKQIPGRGHALTIDDGWREVADEALAFVERFVPARQ